MKTKVWQDLRKDGTEKTRAGDQYYDGRSWVTIARDDLCFGLPILPTWGGPYRREVKRRKQSRIANRKSQISDVVLTRRQAELLVSVAEAYAKVHGLTPDESLLVGAAARRVEAATSTGSGQANGREGMRMKSGN